MKEISVGYGHRKLEICIPRRNLVSEVSLNEISPIADVETALMNSFYNPVGSHRLDEILAIDDDYIIIVDDHTRNVPTKDILNVLCSELERNGLAKDKINIVVATGTHRKSTQQELSNIVGVSALTRYNVIVHDAYSSELTRVGKTSYGNEVYLNAQVVRKRIIVVSDTNIHYFAGYGGGRKSILPGVGGYETIRANHAMIFNKNCGPGNIVNNPVHEEMDEVVDMIGVDFSVQVVLNSKGKILAVYSGDIRKAFLESTKLVDVFAKYSVEQPVDVAILDVGGSPYDCDFHQAFKAVTLNTSAIKEGGAYFLVAECIDGIGYKQVKDLEKIMKKSILNTPLKEHLANHFHIGVHKSFFLKKVLERNALYMVTSIDGDYMHNVFGIHVINSTNRETIHDIACSAYGLDYKCLVVHNATEVVCS